MRWIISLSVGNRVLFGRKTRVHDRLGRTILEEPENVTDDPREGDIAVFARGAMSGSDGHVGFFVADEGGPTVKILGGNQSDSVCYQNYPKDGDLGSTHYKLLGIRRG